MKITEIKLNPNNPRVIKDDKFAKLKKSIQDFPQMLELRPLIIDENNIVLGGNMRLRALQDLGIDEVPIIYAKDLTEEQKKEFTIKDNLNYGEWDWDTLANKWDNVKLEEWGLDVWNFSDVKNAEDISTNNQMYKSTDDLAMDYLNNEMKKFEIYIEKKDYDLFIQNIQLVKIKFAVQTNSDAMLKLVLTYKP